jgi:hypothetical protein
VAVTFLVVSLGLAFFAETYRATLVHGQHDQAAFAVPRDLIASEDLTKLVTVTEAAPLAEYERVGDAVPVVREQGAVSRLTNSAGFTLLGIPTATIPSTGGWRGDFSATSLRELARRLTPVTPTAMRGLRLPADGRELTWPASITGGYLRVRAFVLTRRDDYTSFLIGQLQPGSKGLLRARVPSSARGGLLTSLSLELANYELHDLANAGINLERRAVGDLRFGTLRVDGRAVPIRWPRWIGVNGVQPRGGGLVHYHVTPSLVSSLRARQPTDGVPVPVVTTKAIAAAAGRGGIVPVEITGQRLLTRVVGVAKRFPSVEGDFVLADRQTVSTALSADVPGSGDTNEVWIDLRDGVDVAAAIERRPLSALAVASRSAYGADLESDPLARGSLLTLTVAALTALALALVGLVLAVVADLRDEGGELLDLEAQGADPAMLRRHLRLRALLVGAFGVVGGLGTGAAMSALVVDLVALTANATVPQPPLVLAVDWRLLLIGLGGYLVLAGALVVLVTMRLRLAAARPVAEAGA